MSVENPVVKQAVVAAKKKRRCFGYLFYGDSQKDIECKPIPQFPGITTLLELFAVLEKCWSKETAYPSCQKDWVPITGIGMQGHYNIYDNPTIEDFEKAIQMYLELVDDIQITEFDVRINHEAGGGLSFSRGEGQVLSDSIAELQKQKYAELFTVLRKYKKNFSCVTFWNLGDRDSWLGANNFPLLFDSQYQRKEVYYTVRDFKK